MGVRLVVRSSANANTTSEVTYAFDHGRIVIGRGTGADVRLPHRAVSETHATIRQQGMGYIVVDEGSTNGTYVNDVALAPSRPKPLRTRDVIRIGGFSITFESGLAVSERTSAERTASLARRLVREALDSTLPSARLLVLNGPREGHALELPTHATRLVIGRAEQCDLVLNDSDASREHAEVVRDFDGVIIRDLGSKNGLIINDRPTRERRLKDRDEIVIGATSLVFEDPEERALEALENEPDMPSSELSDADDPPSGAENDGKHADPNDRLPSEAAVASSSAKKVARPQKATRRLDPDLVIYVLAAAVLLLSLAGFFLLLKAE